MRRGRLAKNIVCFVFMIIGLSFLIGVPMIVNAIHKDCTMEVTATIVDVSESYDDGTTMYSPIYEMEINGETVNRQASYSTNVYPDIGKEVTLLADPNNPENFYEPGVDKMIKLIFRIVGGVFAAVGVIVLLVVRV